MFDLRKRDRKIKMSLSFVFIDDVVLFVLFVVGFVAKFWEYFVKVLGLIFWVI